MRPVVPFLPLCAALLPFCCGAARALDDVGTDALLEQLRQRASTGARRGLAIGSLKGVAATKRTNDADPYSMAITSCTSPASPSCCLRSLVQLHTAPSLVQ